MRKYVGTGALLAGISMAVTACTSGGTASPGATAATATPTSGASSTTLEPTAPATASATPTDSATPTPTTTPFSNDQGKTLADAHATGGTVVTANGVKAQLQVHPDTVVVGVAADVKGVAVPKNRIPVYVTVTYTNAGTTVLEYPSLATGLVVKDSTGTPGVALPDAKVAACKSPDSPPSFTPQLTFTDCEVYLIHKGSRVSEVGYRSGGRDTEITWKIPKA